MFAFKGDHIVVDRGRRTPRYAEVISNDHHDGQAPFWVRWADTGEEGWWTPTASAAVEHAGPTYQPEYDHHG